MSVTSVPGGAPRTPTLTLPRKGEGTRKIEIRLRLTPSPLAGEGRGGGSRTWHYQNPWSHPRTVIRPNCA
jgi:hypothetical protein